MHNALVRSVFTLIPYYGTKFIGKRSQSEPNRPQRFPSCATFFEAGTASLETG